MYFPITDTEQSFASTMGRWRWKLVEHQHQPLRKYLEGLQPFEGSANDWLRILNTLALQSKHIDLRRRLINAKPHGYAILSAKAMLGPFLPDRPSEQAIDAAVVRQAVEAALQGAVVGPDEQS